MALKSTHIINLDAVTQFGLANAYTISGVLESDIVVVSKPSVAEGAGMTWDAWSAFSSDVVAAPPAVIANKAWVNGFRIADGSNVDVFLFSTYLNGLGQYPGDYWHADAATALARMQAYLPLRFTGETTYKIYGSDSPVTDNRGGLSLLVQVYDGEDGALVFPPCEDTGVGGGTGTGLPKLELRIRVPDAGWSMSVTDANGTNDRLIPAGDYYLNSVAPGGTLSLLEQIADALTAGAVTYAVVCDDDVDDATGRITISANSSFSISWTNTILRDALGFAGSGTISGTTVTGTKHALNLWMPNGQRVPDEPDAIAGEDTQDFGTPEWDYVATVSPSGATTQSTFSERWRTRFVFDPLLGHKCKISVEQIENESLERFLRSCMAAGGAPWRYHNHREDDATYWTQVFDQDMATFRPPPTVPSWVGGLSHWHAEFNARKYIPLLTDGVLE